MRRPLVPMLRLSSEDKAKEPKVLGEAEGKSRDNEKDSNLQAIRTFAKNCDKTESLLVMMPSASAPCLHSTVLRSEHYIFDNFGLYAIHG